MPRYPSSGRRTRLAVVLGAAAVVAAVGFALFPDSGTSPAPAVSVNDVSGRATACLAADSSSAASGDAVARIWSAMQTAGTQHDANVQQLIEPAADAAQAGPYLAGLLAQHCDLIVTVGRPFGQAGPGLSSSAPASVSIIAVDSALSTAPAGVTLLTGPDAPTRVAERVGALRRQPSASRHTG